LEGAQGKAGLGSNGEQVKKGRATPRPQDLRAHLSSEGVRAWGEVRVAMESCVKGSVANSAPWTRHSSRWWPARFQDNLLPNLAFSQAHAFKTRFPVHHKITQSFLPLLSGL
jgi:hypothetical protein